MAFRVPTVDRVNPSAPESVGRLDVNMPMLSDNVRQNQNMIEKVSGDVASYFDEQEKHAMDTRSEKVATDFSLFINDQIEGENGLKYYKGDPSSKYDEISQSIDKKYSEALNKEGLSEREKTILRKKLDQAYNHGAIKANTTFGSLYNSHEKKITDDAVELRKKNLVDNVQILNIKDPEGFAMIDKTISDIENLRWDQGVKNGSVSKAQDGKMYANESQRLVTANDLSEGLYRAIDVLSQSGKTEEATAMMERYKDKLDESKHKAQADRIQKDEIRKQALMLAERAKTLNPEDVDKFISSNARGTNKLEIADQALKLVDAHQRRVDNMKGRQERENFETSMSYIREKQNSDNPWTNQTEMMDDPMLREIMRKGMSAKQIDTMSKMAFSNNKVSDIETKGELYDMMNSTEGFKGVPFEKLASKLVKLNKKDQMKFEKSWSDDQKTTPSEDRQRLRAMDEMLREELIVSKQVQIDQLGRIFGTQSNRKYLEVRDKMTEAIEKFPPGMSMENQRKWVKKFMVDNVAGKTFSPPVTLDVPAPKPPTGVGFDARSAEKKARAIISFKRANGGRSPTPEEMAGILKEGK